MYKKIKKFMKYTKLEANQIIYEIEKTGYKLKPYEHAFLKSIARWNVLTEKQSTVLTKIYERSVGAGDYVNRQRF